MRSGGEVRRKVQIQSQQKTNDTTDPTWADANTMTWVTQKTVSAGFSQLSANERQESNQEQSEVVVRVYIRYMAYRSLNASHRLLYTLDGVDHILDIESVVLPKLDRRGDWVVMCSQGLNEG